MPGGIGVVFPASAGTTGVQIWQGRNYLHAVHEKCFAAIKNDGGGAECVICGETFAQTAGPKIDLEIGRHLPTSHVSRWIEEWVGVVDVEVSIEWSC